MREQGFYNSVAATAVVLVLALGVAGSVLGPSYSAAGQPPAKASWVNLTVTIDPVTGWPRFSPANFTLPVGVVTVTIVDNDSAMAWTQCACRVMGTVGGVERVNGTPVWILPSTNVAHTFTVPALGVNVLSPGQSAVSFSVDLTKAGTFLWFCEAPCGGGSDPYTTPPMGVAGFMSGTITVV